MSPEQFTGETVDLRTDIYSAGVVLYQLLTGERPFEGGLTTIMHKVLNAEPPKPSQISALCTPSLDAVVAKAMAKNRDRRYGSAEAFARALGRAEAGGTAVNVRRTAAVRPPEPIIRPPSWPPRLPRRLRYAHPFASVVIGISMVALGGAAVWVAETGWPKRHTEGALVRTPAPLPKTALKTVGSPSQAPHFASLAPPPASTPNQPAEPIHVPPSGAPQNPSGQGPALLGKRSLVPSQTGPIVPPSAPKPSPPKAPPHEHAVPAPPGSVEALIERLRKGEQAMPPPSGEPKESVPLPKQAGNWIGLHVKPIASETLKPIGGSGLVVTDVDASSAAAQKGVKPGDVVLSYNDRPVRSVIAFNRAAASTPMGQLVSIDIWRDDQVTEVEITRADQPTKDDQ
jgi:PDZ domain